MGPEHLRLGRGLSEGPVHMLFPWIKIDSLEAVLPAHVFLFSFPIWCYFSDLNNSGFHKSSEILKIKNLEK